MTNIYILAIDLAKRSFQVCATDRDGAVLYNRMISRTKLEKLLEAQTSCIVAWKPVPPATTGGELLKGLGMRSA